jgi:hypothetical protein
MRSILHLPKLPTLKPKVVGILVIAAVLVVVFAVQKSPDGFQNNKTNCFNPVCYANNNPDLKKAFGAGTDKGSAQKLWNHWYWQGGGPGAKGGGEGRNPCCPPTTTASPTSTAPSPVLNPTSPLSVKQAEEMFVNANNALASVVKELNRWQYEKAAAEEAAHVSAAAAEAAARAHASRKAEVAAAMAAVKRLQDDLELKKKAVVNAQQALDNARRAQQLPTTNTNCPYTTLEGEKLVDSNKVDPIMPPCPACYTAVGFVRAGWMPWSGMLIRCLRNDIVQRDPKMWFHAANEAVMLAQRAQQMARTPEEAQAAQARMVAAVADVKAAQAAASGLNTTTK